MNRRSLLTGAPALAWLAACRKAPVAPAVERGSRDPFAVQRAIARAVARSFDLRHDEIAGFEDGWALYKRIVHLGDDDTTERRRRLQHEARDEIEAALGRVKAACQGHPSDAPGHRLVHRAPVEGRKYAVFSDHHRIYHGHRTNFFGASGNGWLYADALARYRDAGFTVIENGDVEDLVLFDPAWEPGELALRRDLDLDALRARRLEVRLAQLRRTLDDPVNAPLYVRLAELDADGRLIHTVGNHDYDLQRDEFLAVLREKLPNLERPADYVLLDRADRTTAFAILHGHQLDLSTNPVSAPRYGETVSECLGLYVQGPDRVWRWPYDGVAEWASGRAPFRDHLAVDKAELTASSVAALAGQDVAELDFDVDVDAGHARGNLRDLWHRMGEALFQDLFKHDIGWDYFKSIDPHTGTVDPGRAFEDEVLPGDRFFKFRILDEEFVREQMLATFPDAAARPILVLGHSHEPRLEPVSRVDGQPFRWYLNAGSAGRFENLVWGLEIVDGHATLVSWSREAPPNGPAERREWRVAEPGLVRASSEPADPP